MYRIDKNNIFKIQDIGIFHFEGCLFDGKMYSSGEQIVIAHCLGAMTCLGNNAYGDLQQWGQVVFF